MRLPHRFLERAKRNINLQDYAHLSIPIRIIPAYMPHRIMPLDQYILRMCIRTPDCERMMIPDELFWLSDYIHICDRVQTFNNLPNEYVYVTVRHGEIKSVTDDEWHVDGFSMRIPHLPEQDYIWCNKMPTQYLGHSIPVEPDFDPQRHNLHKYIQRRAMPEHVMHTMVNTINLIDPYCVHRRPMRASLLSRTFWRVTFSAIPIEDGTNTINPVLEMPAYPVNKFRDTLVSYDEDKNNHGSLADRH